jgi:hypothetical protein
MKMRWHHLVTYAASLCLPPPQPQSMSTPLSHFLVDFHLSPSSWPTTTIIVIISILHLLASSFTPLLSCVPHPSLPIFHRGRVLFGIITVATSVTATVSVSVSLLPPTYSVWLLCTDGHCRCLLLPCLSFNSSSFSMEPLPPLPLTSHCRLPLLPQSHLFLPP